MLADLKITQLRHFLWVAELKGFHAAAQRAHRTQPAISLSIRDLEGKLGHSLFEKHASRTNKTELTPFGREFHPKAQALVEHHDRLAQDMERLAKHQAGHLRLASVPSLASRFLPQLLEDFLDDSPGLHISCYDDNARSVLRMVESQQVDFALANLASGSHSEQLVFTPVWQDQIGVVCRTDHPLASCESLDWQQLLPHKLIANGTSRLLENSDAHQLLAHSDLYVSNMISLMAMLRSGLGVTTLPQFAFDERESELCFIPLHNPQVIRPLGIVQPANRSLSPPAEAFLAFILQRHGQTS